MDFKKINLLLWCSPGFGLVDMWLPVIRNLKENNDVMIDFVFPEPSSLRLEEKNSTLFKVSEKFANRVIYRGYSGRWFASPTLTEACSGIKFSKFDEKIMNISIRLLEGNASKYLFLKVIGKYILVFLKYFISIKENFFGQCLYDISFLKNKDGVLCDITTEEKNVNNELREELKNLTKFSMFHGASVTWVTPDFNCEKAVIKRPDVVVYNASNFEKNGYKRCFGVLEKNLIHVGIPKHDKDWIDFIGKQCDSIEEEVFKPFVFVIGRPASPYNRPERKKKALKDIYDIVCTKYKLNLVVKTHPKESLDGVDGNIYNEALGVENYGKNWMYSNIHPFVLGKKSIFSICFYSGVSLDMLAINKPTVEYLDLDGLPAYDNQDSFRDKLGIPVLQFRYINLVLGVSSKLELDKNIKLILSQYDETFLKLRLKYEEYFEPFDSSSEIVANDIINRLTQKGEYD